MSKLIHTAALAVFAQYPKEDVVYVTEDGNAFLEHAKQLAQNHARQAGLPEPVKVLRGAKAEVAKAVATQSDGLSEAERRADAEAEASRKKLEDDKAATDAAAEEEAKAKADADKVAADAAVAAPAKPKGKAKGKGK